MRSHHTAEPAVRIAPNFRVQTIYAEQNQETVETKFNQLGFGRQSKPEIETNVETRLRNQL
jgi:hypothetical protein